MNLALIKIGKALAVLQREGLRGVRRVVGGFLLLLRRWVVWGRGDVLFVSGGAAGDSVRYRCDHVAEELQLHGKYRCAVTAQDHPFLVSLSRRYRAVVLHRVLYTSAIASLLGTAKDDRRLVIFETDDLVHDPRFLVHMDYYQKMSPLERKQYEHGVGGEILEDPVVIYCTTTTPFLQANLSSYNKDVHIIRNKLSRQDILWAAKGVKKRKEVRNRLWERYCQGGKELMAKSESSETYKELRMKNGACPTRSEELIVKSEQLLVISNQRSTVGPKLTTHHSPPATELVFIGYFSGTKSHDKDFATITPALLAIFSHYPHVHLFLAGPLTIDSDLNIFGSRIHALPFVPRQKHFATMAAMDIILAPLEVGNPFCEAKSELKWFEAGIVCVPVVAAATGTFINAIAHGIDGFVAKDPDGWEKYLSLLIKDQNLRQAIGTNAKEKVMRLYTTAGESDGVVFYREILG